MMTSALRAWRALHRESAILRRMQAGVVSSLEVEDASPTSAALMALQRWVEQIAEQEVDRITAKCQRYETRANRSHAGSGGHG